LTEPHQTEAYSRNSSYSPNHAQRIEFATFSSVYGAVWEGVELGRGLSGVGGCYVATSSCHITAVLTSMIVIGLIRECVLFIYLFITLFYLMFTGAKRVKIKSPMAAILQQTY